MKRSLTALLFVCSLSAASTEAWKQQVEHANALVDQGDLNHAEAIYKTAIAQATTPVQTGVALQNLARLQDRRGDTLAAEKSYLRALSVLRDADRAFTVRAATGLSTIYLHTGRSSKAEALIQSCLNDATGADRATLLGNLGVVLAHKRKYTEAARLFQESAAATTSPEVQAIAIANLAGLYFLDDRKGEAAAAYHHALDILDTVPDASPATVGVTLSDYANTLEDPAAAERYHLQAIDHIQRRLGPEHSLLGNTLERYAALLRRTKRKSEAKEVAQRARAILEAGQQRNLTGHTVEAVSLVPTNPKPGAAPL